MSRRLGSVTLALACVALLAACEGPEGPAGPAGATGPAGTTGAAGPVGPAGADANENCVQCHTDDAGLFAKQVQYQASIHRNGGNFRRGSSASCAQCHSSQGFQEFVATGAVAAGFDEPAPVNCRTCHMIHETYTSADFALRTTDPITPMTSFLGTTLDFGEKANLCAECHTGRTLSPVPVIDGPDLAATSSRYGWHHNPNGAVLLGIGAFEFTGSATINGGPNTHGDIDDNADMCVGCHMVAPRGDQAGGHTWNMSYDDNGTTENYTDACEACHTAGLDSFDDHPFGGSAPQTEILGLLIDLETELVRIGIKRVMTPGYTIHELDGLIFNEDSGEVDFPWPANVLAAMANWSLFAEDRSLGIHNPAYARAVLTNSIEAVTGIAPIIIP